MGSCSSKPPAAYAADDAKVAVAGPGTDGGGEPADGSAGRGAPVTESVASSTPPREPSINAPPSPLARKTKAAGKRKAPPSITIPTRMTDGMSTSPVLHSPGLPPYMALERSDSMASVTSTGSREVDIAEQMGRKRAVRHRRVDVFAAAPDELTAEGSGGGTRVVIPKSDDVRALIGDALRAHFLFANLAPRQMEEILDAFGPESAGTNDIVVREGDSGDRFYVLEAGAVHIVRGDETLASLGERSYFGELALLYNCPRTASVIATTPCKLWSVDSVTFKRIVCCHAAQEITELVHFLQRVPLLQALTANQCLQLAEALHPANYEEGEVIVQQGDPGEMFYLLKEGEVMVTQVGEDGQHWELAHLHAGQFFGERALLNTDVRSATVTATIHSKCLVLDRTDFVAMLGPLQMLMEHQHDERMKTPASPFSGLRRGRLAEAEAQALSQVRCEDLETLASLGQGAFGLVTLVRHTPTNQAFALKAMNKAKIVEAKQTQGVVNERRILSQIQHPLVLQLVATFQDPNRLYMVLEFLQGGDLFSLMLREGGLFSVSNARFYVASVVSVFEMLHRKKIIYRDLKPENLVLNDRGYCKVVDFGFAKETQDRTYTFCGTPEYLAPEIIANKGHGKGVDCWALGVLTFELVSGFSPFSSSSGDQMEIYKRIMKVHFDFPRHVNDENLKDLVRRCFVKNPSKRIGCLKNGMIDIKKHRFMRGFDWAGLHSLTLPPPFVPELRDTFDASCFEAFTASSRHDKPYTGSQDWCSDF